VVEAEDDELHRSNRHAVSPLQPVVGPAVSAAAASGASSDPGEPPMLKSSSGKTPVSGVIVRGRALPTLPPPAPAVVR
jgi:hypothetical protein